ncbi:MAG TPA: Hpt domain-containing protein [Longimicrobiaceae bacterium]|nr:Hpt domain-containing protein [Longimicrobiaceae bacterium]
MSQRLNQYFTRETEEYLQHLQTLLDHPGTPEPEDLLRLARGVRGSARMAGAETLASVAERLEDAARSVLTNNVVWSEEIRLLAAQTVGDLQLLVRALNRWGPEEEARVRAAIERWDDLDPGEAASDLPVVPVEDLYYEDAGPHILSQPTAAAEEEGGVVPVQSLLFRGEAALREALRLRPHVEALAREAAPNADALAEGLREIFDLVELGLTPDARA